MKEKNLIFKVGTHVEVVPPNRVFLFNEKEGVTVLEGVLYVALAPLLLSKKGCSPDRAIEGLEKRFSPADIYRAFFRLQKKKLVEELKNFPKHLVAFSHFLNLFPEKVAHRVEETSIVLHSLGNLSVKPLEKILRKFSIQSTSNGEFNVVITDHYRRRELEDLNLKKLKEGKPWLLMKPTGNEIWIGPLFVPQKTACYQCLLEVLERNAIGERWMTPKFIESPTLKALAWNFAANEIFRWIAQGENPNLEGKIMSLASFSLQLESHYVMKKTECSACGKRGLLQELLPISLESQKEHFTEDGGYRVISPEETYRKYRHLISPITGIIGSLESMHSDPSSCLLGFRASFQKTHSKLPLMENRWAASGGKGKSEAQAKVSCLCEAIERFSGLFYGNEIRRKATFMQIREEAIHPNDLLLFSESQYAIRESWNQNCSEFHFIPHPFDETKEIDWTPVWSLTAGQFKWIPTAICYYSYPFENPEQKFCVGDSNGSASGNTKEEAILQGLFELVERDSVAIWWYSQIQRPRVDLDSFEDNYLTQLCAHYASRGREVWALDVTMDLNIPTFVAVSHLAGKEILFGFGAHFDPKIALCRAFTEMNLLLYDFKQVEEGSKIAEFLRKMDLKEQTYFSPDPNALPRKYQDYVCRKRKDLKEEILECQRVIEEKGMEILILDQTRPDIGLPVMKVFVPGLRPFWNRFAKGRLYDVPFELGYLKHRLKEENLNPIPIFV